MNSGGWGWLVVDNQTMTECERLRVACAGRRATGLMWVVGILVGGLLVIGASARVSAVRQGAVDAEITHLKNQDKRLVLKLDRIEELILGLYQSTGAGSVPH